MDDNNSESSTPSVRENLSSLKLPLLDRTPLIGIPPILWDSSEIRFGPSTYPVVPPLKSSATHTVFFRP